MNNNESHHFAPDSLEIAKNHVINPPGFFFLRFVLPNAGAVGCLDCTCSSAEGIHGETRRTTFQQRHFVTDPSPNGAVGTSSAIVQTRNWRFCQLAVVSWLICSFSHCKKTV